MSKVVKDPKEIDEVELYQFFSNFALERPGRREPGPAQAAQETAKEPPAPPAPRDPEELLSEAKAKANKLLDDARKQCELLRQQAYEEGRAEGVRDGYEAAYEEHRAEYDKTIRELQRNAADVLASVRTEKTRVMEKYQDDLKRTVMAIAEKIIHTSLKSSEDVIRRMILAATDKLKKTQWAKIYITKCGTDITVEADAEFLNGLSRLSDNVKIVGVDSGEEGLCIIELPDEIVDASVSTQMENIKDILNNARI